VIPAALTYGDQFGGYGPGAVGLVGQQIHGLKTRLINSADIDDTRPATPMMPNFRRTFARADDQKR
jgi:hypothetical protein